MITKNLVRPVRHIKERFHANTSKTKQNQDDTLKLKLAAGLSIRIWSNDLFGRIGGAAWLSTSKLNFLNLLGLDGVIGLTGLSFSVASLTTGLFSGGRGSWPTGNLLSLLAILRASSACSVLKGSSSSLSSKFSYEVGENRLGWEDEEKILEVLLRWGFNWKFCQNATKLPTDKNKRDISLYVLKLCTRNK